MKLGNAISSVLGIRKRAVLELKNLVVVVVEFAFFFLLISLFSLRKSKQTAVRGPTRSLDLQAAADRRKPEFIETLARSENKSKEKKNESVALTYN